MAHSNGTGKEAKRKSYIYYVPCRVEPGMFRNEWLVHLDAVDPADPNETIQVQLLVDERDVRNIHGTPKRNDPAQGWLRVAVAGRAKGLVQVVFPQPALPVGESAYVEEDLVRHEVGV